MQTPIVRKRWSIAEGYHIIVPACRTKQARLNVFADPESIPSAVAYASIIESDVPIVLQYLRYDSRLAENALVSTVAYACDDGG